MPEIENFAQYDLISQIIYLALIFGFNYVVFMLYKKLIDEKFPEKQMKCYTIGFATLYTIIIFLFLLWL